MNIPDPLRQKVPDLSESAYTTLTVRAADKWPENSVQRAATLESLKRSLKQASYPVVR
jgi:hypothetical protein